jgi:hypothetical protein
MSVNIDFKNIEDQIKNLVEESFKGLTKEANADATAFLQMTAESLKRWAQEYQDGKLTQDDVEDLLLGQKDLAAMEGLKQIGVAAIKLDTFKNNILNIFLNVVTQLIPIPKA